MTEVTAPRTAKCSGLRASKLRWWSHSFALAVVDTHLALHQQSKTLHQHAHAVTDMLAALPDDVLRRIVRACVRLLDQHGWPPSARHTTRSDLSAKFLAEWSALLPQTVPSFAYHELLQLRKGCSN